MSGSNFTDLNGIPYLNHEQLSGRFISTLAFYDGDWRLWLDTTGEMQKFVEVKAWPAESFYWAKEPELAADIGSIFMDFIAQRANFPQVMRNFAALQDDYLNISASLSKFELIFNSDKGSGGAVRLAATELEYLLTLCRSIFDLLQEIIEKIWSRISLIDASAKKKQIKKKFSDMTLYGDRGDLAFTAEEIERKFFLPPRIAQCYARNSSIFSMIRKFRDNIIHRGYRSEIIFKGDRSFLIHKQIGPFKNLDIWRAEEIETNELVPLMPVLGMIVHSTLLACEDFAETLLGCIAFPPPIVPGTHLFMRGYYNQVLIDVLTDVNSRLKEGRSLLPLT